MAEVTNNKLIEAVNQSTQQVQLVLGEIRESRKEVKENHSKLDELEIKFELQSNGAREAIDHLRTRVKTELDRERGETEKRFDTIGSVFAKMETQLEKLTNAISGENGLLMAIATQKGEIIPNGKDRMQAVEILTKELERRSSCNANLDDRVQKLEYFTDDLKERREKQESERSQIKIYVICGLIGLAATAALNLYNFIHH